MGGDGAVPYSLIDGVTLIIGKTGKCGLDSCFFGHGFRVFTACRDVLLVGSGKNDNKGSIYTSHFPTRVLSVGVSTPLGVLDRNIRV